MQNFYKCDKCDMIFAGLRNVQPVSDSKLKLIEPNTVDAAVEKHVPDVEYRDGKLFVQIGSTKHPMLTEHYIEWIFVQTKSGGMFKYLKPGEEPVAEFVVDKGDVVCVFEYCNLHGLWMKDM